MIKSNELIILLVDFVLHVFYRAIKVGGLFADNEVRPVQEAVFTHAIENVNSDKSVLLKARLLSHMETVTPGNSIKASKIVCAMVGKQGQYTTYS